MRKRKPILLLLCLFLFMIGQAQILKNINVTTAGTLSTLLTANELSTVTDLTVTGNIDARDILVMRDAMPKLLDLSISDVSIIAYSGSEGTFNSYVVLYPANEMPQYSFYNRKTALGKITLKSVILPNTITSIGEFAFNCSGITGRLNIPNTVISIGDWSFGNCSGLTGNLIIPNNVFTIGSYSFCNCIGLTGNLIIPNTIKGIGTTAFSNCSGFTSLIIGNGVKSIEESAFNNCNGLTSIIIGSGVKNIRDYAFNSCSSLKIISILNYSPPTLDGRPFYGASPNIVYVPTSSETNYKTTYGWTSFNIVSEKRVTIKNRNPGSLASQLLSAGYGPLSSITHLTVTGELNNVDISQLNTNMTALTSIDLSGTLFGNTFPDYAFQNKKTLAYFTFPQTIGNIGNYAFSGCTVLSGDIILPSSVTTIGDRAFEQCTSLTGALTLPSGIKTINTSIFAGCCGLSNLIIGNGVTSIGNDAFEGCSGFKGSLTIPNSVTSIGSTAFYNCSGLTEVTIPNSVSLIGSWAFRNCSGLSVVTIGNSVTSIEDGAFSNCNGLKIINSLNSVPPKLESTSVFEGLAQVKDVYVPSDAAVTAYKANKDWIRFFPGNIIKKVNLTNKSILANNHVKVYSLAEGILVEGTNAGEIVILYTIIGKQLQCIKSLGTNILLTAQHGAVYLIKTETKTFKVIL